MNISAWSIRNPVPAVLLFVLLCFLGMTGFRALGIQNFPDIELPTIMISAVYEGAAPAQLETEVARKIEDQLASLAGVEHIHSNLTDGSAQIYVEFGIDKDTEVALNEVRNALGRADLPADLRDPVVSKITTAGSPLLTYAVQSNSMDEEALSWFIDNQVTKALLAVKGVGKVGRIGGVNREVQVELDHNRLVSLGLTAGSLSELLRQVQQDLSGGRGDIGSSIQSVRTLAAVNTVAELAQLPIPIGAHSFRLDSIASVTDTIAEPSSMTLVNGKPAVSFDVTRTKGASEVAVAKAVREVVAKLQQQHPQLHLAEAFNTVAPVEDNYSGSMELLYEGALLAVIVVWCFLRDWRATLVSAVALPLSIIPTFAAMYFLNFSLNTLTLLALALVVGILVDDAIVEVENIVRHLRMGKSPLQAATEAADEIGLAVIATTLTLVAVFAPTAFMGGVPGKFFKQFGITAAVAVVASLLVARLLTPMMAAYFLQAHPPQEHQGWIMRSYLRTARWCMNHRKTTLLFAIAFFAGSLSLRSHLPSGFVPAADRAQTRVSIELQPGSTLNQTWAVAEQARQLVQSMPEVTQVFSAIGAGAGAVDGPFAGGGTLDPRKATLTLSLTSRHQRKKQNLVEADIRQKLAGLAGVRVAVGAGQTGEKLQLVLAGDEPLVLQQVSQRVTDELRSIPGIGNVTSGASLQRPEVHITPDFERAADLGVTAADMASLIRIATAGDFDAKLPKLNLPQRQIPIRVRLQTSLRQDINALGQLRLNSNRGQIPLAAVAKLEMGSGPAQIDRFDRQRNVVINVELAGRQLGEVLALANQLPSLAKLPPGISRPPSGDAERMAELFGSFGSAMLIGVLCIYMVLVLLFHDFLQPATILAALPLSIGGAFVALLLTHNSFSMPSVIGLLMLMGIVTKNSILLVEYAVMARREHGMNRFDALMDACHKRAQPILMTTIAMVAGMLPIALGLGAEPSFRAPMAIAVIGGLLTSTLLSLLVIPVVFTYVDDLLLRLKRMAGWLHRFNHR